MASRLIDALFRTDPTTGFVDYVLTVKPYHTKILETLVEYVWTEQINVIVCDRDAWVMDFTRPNPPVAYDCGYGIIWDAPPGFASTAYQIIGVVTGSGGSWTILGDHTALFVPGTLFVVGRNIGGGNGWYLVASSTLVSGNTVVTISSIPPIPPSQYWLTSITSSSPHGFAYIFDTSKDSIINSDSTSNAFVVIGDQTDKYFEGVYITVDNTYLNRNTGTYYVQNAFNSFAIIGVTPGVSGSFTVQGYATSAFAVGSTFIISGNGIGDGIYTVVSVALNSISDTVVTVASVPLTTTITGTLTIPNTIVFTKQEVQFSKPSAVPFDGRMYLASLGYDEPAYCRLARAGDLHTDAFIGETLVISISDFDFDIANSDVLEDEPRAFGVMGFGTGSFGAPEAGFPATVPTTGISIIPSGLDALYFDVGGLDEDLSTVVHLYGHTV